MPIISGRSNATETICKHNAWPEVFFQVLLRRQRERAELRVERDQKNLENLKQKMQEDQQRVREYQRLEAERGGASDAVKMIFPTS